MIVEDINNLTHKEKKNILFILKEHKVEYTKNSNGFFFNINDIPTDVQNKITSCISLMTKNKNILVQLNEEREKYILQYKQIIEDRIFQTEKKKKDEEKLKLQLKPLPVSIDFHKKILQKLPDHIIEQKIRECSRSKKYDKNTVYYRLNYIFKNRKEKIIDFEDSVDCDFNTDLDVEPEFEEDPTSFELPEPEQFLSDDEISIHPSHHSDDKLTEELSEDEGEVEYIGLTDKLEYFKKILISHGFNFKYNTSNVLVFEEYIH